MPANGLYDGLKFWSIQLLVLYDAVRRRLNPRPPAEIRVTDGFIRPGSQRTLCVFAHYDRDGLIDDYVIHYLSELSRADCEIVFVSTAPNVGDETVDRVRPYASRILLRENVGYDFGSWRDGLALIGDFGSYDRVIIANDSVYGPLTDLRAVFAKMAHREAPVWGITDSLRYARHLQSYFIVFEREAVQSVAFNCFWKSLPDYRSKHVVIMQCEVGLSRRLTEAGFELAALCDYKSMASSPGWSKTNAPKKRIPGVPVNATHWKWRTLIEEHGCPFIKVQLLRDNPKGILDVTDWKQVVEKISNYDVRLICRHLKRMSSSA